MKPPDKPCVVVATVSAMSFLAGRKYLLGRKIPPDSLFSCFEIIDADETFLSGQIAFVWNVVPESCELPAIDLFHPAILLFHLFCRPLFVHPSFFYHFCSYFVGFSCNPVKIHFGDKIDWQTQSTPMTDGAENEKWRKLNISGCPVAKHHKMHSHILITVWWLQLLFWICFFLTSWCCTKVLSFRLKYIFNTLIIALPELIYARGWL